ncbi:MAG: serine hydrolase [Patescibacteria group bacterium]
MEFNIQKTEGKFEQVISKRLLVLNGIMVFGIIGTVFLIYGLLNIPKEEDTAFTNPVIMSNAFANIAINAKSAYVFDVSANRAVYKKDEFVQMPLASITKLMTAVVATESVPENSKITIRKEFLLPSGDSGLVEGEDWRLKDLLDFSLVVSSNDGTYSIASVVGAMSLNSTDYEIGREEFIKKMNDKAKELGLFQTYFINDSGLDEGLLSGGYGSAIDVAKLMQYALKNHSNILEATKYSELTIDSLDASHSIENTNKEVASIPGVIASKTGFTDMAGGNLVVAFDAGIGQPFIVVVLGGTPEGRFEDISKLVAATQQYITEENK